MDKWDFFGSRWNPACAFVLGLVAVLAVVPTNLAAQCSGCAWDPVAPDRQVCGDPDGTMSCSGASGGVCDPCPHNYPEVPSDLGLDGYARLALDRSDLIGPRATPEGTGSTRTRPSPGFLALETICGIAGLPRQYTEEAAERMRRATATLIFE